MKELTQSLIYELAQEKLEELRDRFSETIKKHPDSEYIVGRATQLVDLYDGYLKQLNELMKKETRKEFDDLMANWEDNGSD